MPIDTLPCGMSFCTWYTPGCSVAVGATGSACFSPLVQPSKAASSLACIALGSKSPLTAMIMLPGWKIFAWKAFIASGVIAFTLFSVG